MEKICPRNFVSNVEIIIITIRKEKSTDGESFTRDIVGVGTAGMQTRRQRLELGADDDVLMYSAGGVCHGQKLCKVKMRKVVEEQREDR